MRCEVRTEIAGNVLDVEAGTGAEVVPGQMLFMLESMKMEIPIIADVTGVVVSVGVASGDFVQAGALLAMVDCR